jgi:hypothetical protein
MSATEPMPIRFEERMPESWDPKIYRERAEAWRQRAALLPEDDPQAMTCLEIAEGYARLAQLIEADRESLRSPLSELPA